MRGIKRIKRVLRTQPFIEETSTTLGNRSPDGVQQATAEKTVANCLLDLKSPQGVLIDAHNMHILMAKRRLELHARTLQPVFYVA